MCVMKIEIAMIDCSIDFIIEDWRYFSYETLHNDSNDASCYFFHMLINVVSSTILYISIRYKFKFICPLDISLSLGG